MSLRVKFLLIFTTTIVLLFAVVMGLVKMIIERQFTAIEMERMGKQSERLSEILESNLRPIVSTAGDWAPWDELYEFASGRFPQFPARNLAAPTLGNLRLDFFSVWNQHGSLILMETLPARLTAEGIDRNVLPDAIIREGLVPQDNIDRPVSGVICVDDNLVLVAALPIVHTNRSGPPAGTLVIGRIVGRHTIMHFEKTSGYRLAFQFPSAEGRQAGAPAIEVVNESLLTGRVPILGPRGGVVAWAELASNRDLHIQANLTLRTFLLCLACAAGILFFLVWYLFDANFILPVRRLGDQLEVATRRSLLASNLDVSGGELGRLARRIETLVRTLAYTETRYRRLFETATDGILIVNLSSRVITDANSRMCRMLECEPSDLVDRPLNNVAAFGNSRTRRILSRLLQPHPPQRGGEIELVTTDQGRCFLEVTATTHDLEGEAILQLNFRDISQRRRANDELRRLSGHLLRLQDEERRRIARDLHDSTAQNLSALQMAITHLAPHVSETPASARVALEEIRSLCDLSLKEIRTISYLLHPPLLDEVGLSFALRWYVDGFMTRTEKIVRLDIPENLERLPSEIETTIFRVVQEALSNIHRHSESRRAWIRLALSQGVLELTIRDEGKGMEFAEGGKYSPEFPIPGVGITGMRERLRQFDGTLEIESGRNGTLIRATLPLGSHEAEND